MRQGNKTADFIRKNFTVCWEEHRDASGYNSYSREIEVAAGDSREKLELLSWDGWAAQGFLVRRARDGKLVGRIGAYERADVRPRLARAISRAYYRGELA